MRQFYNGATCRSVSIPGDLALGTPTPIRDESKTSGRRKAVIALGIGSFLLLAMLVGQASFNLKFISPDSNDEVLFFCGIERLDLLCLSGADARPRAQPAEALRRAPTRRGRLEIPHPPGGGQPAAFVLAGDCDVLVLVWADEPLDRQVVFTTGRGSPRRHGRHVGSAL